MKDGRGKASAPAGSLVDSRSHSRSNQKKDMQLQRAIRHSVIAGVCVLKKIEQRERDARWIGKYQAM